VPRLPPPVSGCLRSSRVAIAQCALVKDGVGAAVFEAAEETEDLQGWSRWF
jgi:hypothetical protein